MYSLHDYTTFQNGMISSYFVLQNNKHWFDEPVICAGNRYYSPSQECTVIIIVDCCRSYITNNSAATLKLRVLKVHLKLWLISVP